jgi:hypothetical protein
MVEWQPRKWFGIYLSTMGYLLRFISNLIRVAVPMGFSAVFWVMQTSVKLVVLVTALFILWIGPKIGLPSAIYQSTWRLLVRLGCVTPTSIARVGRRVAASAASAATGGAPPPGGGSAEEQLILFGFQNMDVSLASSIVTDTMGGVVSEIFWNTVDLLGLGGYFRSVLRQRRRLYERDGDGDSDADVDSETDEDAGVEVVYSEVPGEEVVPGQRRAAGPGARSGEGATVALVLYRVERSSIWGVQARAPPAARCRSTRPRPGAGRRPRNRQRSTLQARAARGGVRLTTRRGAADHAGGARRGRRQCATGGCGGRPKP